MKYLFILLILPALFAFNNCTNAEFSKTLDSVYDKNANGFEIPEDELEQIPVLDDGNSNTGNGNTGNNNGNGSCASSSVCLVIRDNFERSNIIGGDFAWITFLDDLGRNLNNLEVATSDRAPASFGDRSTYFTGRKGSSIHSLYLISKPFDLRGFSRLTIEFDYLMASFESYNNGKGSSGNEHLKVDICPFGAVACGATGTQAASRLNDKNLWLNVFKREATSPINQQFDGFNHSQSSFTRVRGNTISIDLTNDNLDKSNLLFRWNVLVDEGLTANNPDAGIIDNIVVRAYK